MATLKDLLVSGPARVIGNITGKSFIKEGGTSSQFLKADGSVDSNTYSTTSHNHSGTYKPVQTAVSDPTASTTASTTFIDSISQNANGVITATKKTLPTASTTVSGITKVGASGGAAAYNHTHTGYATSSHTHDTLIKKSDEDSRITLAFGTKYAIKAGGTSYVFAMPKNPNTDTTYTFATGDTKGQIKVTPSGGDAYNVNVNGLGSAAYTDSSAYAPVGHLHTGYAAKSHTHATSIATSTGTNQITLAFGTKYAISAGGTSYVFTMPANPDTNTTYKFEDGDNKGQIKVIPSDGDAYNVNVRGLGSAAYTDISDYATSGHTHGSITNAGAIANNTTIANGDHLVITDKSDSDKIKRASITFGTSQSTYLRNDGTWGTPSTSTPTPLATPLFDDIGSGGIPGTVIPIARTENEIAFRGKPITYNAAPSLLFPSASSTFALPIFMDKSGRLLMLIPDKFANDLISTYGYSTVPSGGKS